MQNTADLSAFKADRKKNGLARFSAFSVSMVTDPFPRNKSEYYTFSAAAGDGRTA